MKLAVNSEQLDVIPESVWEVFGFPITNTMLAGLLMTIVIAVIIIPLSRNITSKETPTKAQVFLEMMYQIFEGFVRTITGSQKVTNKILPIIGTVFIYIGVANIIMFIPGLEALQINGTPLFRTHTTDFNATFGIAVGMIIWTHLEGIRTSNILKHVNKYFKVGALVKGFKQGIGAGFLAVVEFFVGLLDVIAELAKSISLSLRLFGNIFAGQLLGSIIMGTFAIFLPVPLILYGIFTGVLQALVFGALTSSYFSTNLAEDRS